MLSDDSDVRWMYVSLIFYIALFTVIACISAFILKNNFIAEGQPQSTPFVKDPKLEAILLHDGLNYSSSFTFVGNDDILYLEKQTGKVLRIVNGQMLDRPLLDVNVANYGERGMLGIAAKTYDNHEYVFLYYTEIQAEDAADSTNGTKPIGNRLYRYELVNNNLINPTLLLDLPGSPGFYHVGGAITIGPDNNIYLPIGDLDHRTSAQNFKQGGKANGTSGILRVSWDGKAVGNGILGNEFPLNLYYAYGIRNSFGIDFDPVTGTLWDTENGPNFGDEINLVEPGFNSGFAKIQGIWEPNGEDKGRTVLKPKDLVDFAGKGKYRIPELIWEYTVGPSAIKFFNSSNFGQDYANDIFVGNVNEESLYHFDLNENRTGLDLSSWPPDRIARTPDEVREHKFAERLGRISDVEVGPDGNLYVLSHVWNEDPNKRNSSIYRIAPAISLDKTDWLTDTNNSITSGPRMDIERVIPNWKVLSSDYIPVMSDSYYNYTLDVSARDVNQLHSKVFYFSSNTTQIGSDFVSNGKDGTFDDLLSRVIKTPHGTALVKLQVWVQPNLEMDSYFIVNNATVYSFPQRG